MNRRTANAARLCSLLLLSLQAGFALASPTENNKPSLSTLIQLKGHGRFTYGTNRHWREASRGDLVAEGVWFQTAAGSYADLVLGASLRRGRIRLSDEEPFERGQSCGPLLRCYEDTVVKLVHVSSRSNDTEEVRHSKEIELKAGKICYVEDRTKPRFALQVRFTNAVAKIESGCISISSAGVVTVLKGSVTIRFDDGHPPITLRRDQEFDARTGQVSMIVIETPTTCWPAIFGAKASDAWVHRPPRWRVIPGLEERY